MIHRGASSPVILFLRLPYKTIHKKKKFSNSGVKKYPKINTFTHTNRCHLSQSVFGGKYKRYTYIYFKDIGFLFSAEKQIIKFYTHTHTSESRIYLYIFFLSWTQCSPHPSCLEDGSALVMAENIRLYIGKYVLVCIWNG